VRSSTDWPGSPPATPVYPEPVPHRRTLADRFPDAVPVQEFLDRVERAVDPLGFLPERTFAAVSVCRDELTQHFADEVAERWNRPFALGGLGALPSFGRTGWGACLSHVPQEDTRGHLVVFGLPHIGIDPDGKLGQSLRRHQHVPTPTCGAMCALMQAVQSGATAEEPLPPGLDDHEAQRLRRLISREAGPLPADLLELTRRAALAVETEMWTELEALGAWEDMDVVVFCGIQIHLPGLPDHVSPTGASVQGADGVRRPLSL
jgi:hypothetical protein